MTSAERGPPTSARAFWVVAPGRGEIRDEPLPDPRDDEVLVRTVRSGISRGTEALVFSGRVPPSEFSRMRCPHQAGDFPGPVKYGYVNVGLVVEGPETLRGRAVFCLYPHQTAYVVPASAVVPLPSGVPVERAVLTANMETALNAVWDAEPRAGDRITIVGAGVVGCLAAYLLSKIPGTVVTLSDVNPARGDTAAALGLGFSTPESAEPERDLVLHTSGSEAGLHTALRLAAPGATVLELSWFGTHDVRLPLGEAFHSKRLTLRASQVGTVSPAARPRFTHRERLALALELLRDPRLDALLDGTSDFSELPATMARLASSAGALCHAVTYA